VNRPERGRNPQSREFEPRSKCGVGRKHSKHTLRKRGENQDEIVVKNGSERTKKLWEKSSVKGELLV